MNIKKIEQVFQQVAEKEGITVNEVRHQIELAIAMAQKNPSPEIQAFWRSVPRMGDKLTPEEALAYMTVVIDK